jgi:hypothetical protein
LNELGRGPQNGKVPKRTLEVETHGLRKAALVKERFWPRRVRACRSRPKSQSRVVFPPTLPSTSSARVRGLAARCCVNECELIPRPVQKTNSEFRILRSEFRLLNSPRRVRRIPERLLRVSSCYPLDKLGGTLDLSLRSRKSSLGVYYLLPATCYRLSAIHWLPPRQARGILPTTYYPLPATCYLLSAIHQLPLDKLGVYYLLPLLTFAPLQLITSSGT